MPYPRAHLIDKENPGFYHMITRCVRRAWLCGEDPITGQNFDHRRGWIEGRIVFLAKQFAVELYAYAVMSNHYHLNVWVDPMAPRKWDDEKVASRWLALCPPRGSQSDPSVLAAHKREIMDDPDRLATYRQRLGDLSWFMRFLNERIARDANHEDGCKGKFWEARFVSKGLLDEPAVYACMTYIDLNPVRAGMVTDPAEASYTSVARRHRDAANTSREPALGLPPIAGGFEQPQQLLSMPEPDYLALVAETARPIADQPSTTHLPSMPAALGRFNVTASDWQHLVYRNQRFDVRVFGGVEAVARYLARIGQRRLRGYRLAQATRRPAPAPAPASVSASP